MGKKENPRFNTRVSKELFAIFERFIEKHNYTQTEFLEKFLPSVMLGIDAELYLKLYKEVYENKEIEKQIKKGEV